MPPASTYDLEYYTEINNSELPQAERLFEILHKLYKPERVIDVGCATGLYLKPFMDAGIEVEGVDYAPDAIDDSIRQIPKDLIHIADITKDKLKIKPADFTICLEVLEHIPKSGAEKSVKYLCSTATTIIFSAAQVGQGGRGHINCQPKYYWLEKFYKNNYIEDVISTNKIINFMSQGYHMGWLTNNLIVFVKR